MPLRIHVCVIILTFSLTKNHARRRTDIEAVCSAPAHGKASSFVLVRKKLLFAKPR